MTNLTDITTMTDAVLDIFLAAKADPNGTHDTDHLTENEQRALYAALGVDVPEWYFSSLAPKVEAQDGFDYEGAILARQDNEADF